MKDLKEELFRKRKFYWKEFTMLEQRLGAFHRRAGLSRAKYNVLFDLIEDCGLKEEYEQWEEQNNDI